MPRMDAVDVSQFNVGVNYQKLRDHGVKYAWVRVWSGYDFDPSRHDHRVGLQKAGIKCFGYWVAAPDQNPNAQGGLARQHLNSDAWDTVNGQHQWALDWELPGLSQSWLDRFGVPPVLYRSLSTANVSPGSRQWIADWGVLHPPAVRNLVAWQWAGGDHLSIRGFSSGGLDASETYFHVKPVFALSGHVAALSGLGDGTQPVPPESDEEPSADVTDVSSGQPAAPAAGATDAGVGSDSPTPASTPGKK